MGDSPTKTTAMTLGARSTVLDVYTNNDLDFKAKKFIVNPRTSHSMEQVIDMLSDALSIVGGVRRLYDVRSGTRIRDLDALYGLKSVVATGKERLNKRLLKTIFDKQVSASGEALARVIRDSYFNRNRDRDTKVCEQTGKTDRQKRGSVCVSE